MASKIPTALGSATSAPVLYRFHQMVQLRRSDLSAILSKHPSRFEREHARRWLAVLNERVAAVTQHTGFHGEAVAQATLARFGGNGWGPAIDMAAREARAVRS